MLSSLEKQRDINFGFFTLHFPHFYSWNLFSSKWPLSISIMYTSDTWTSLWKDRWNLILRTRFFFVFFFFKEYYGSLCFQQKRENDFITCNHIVTFLFVLWMCGVFWYEEIFLKIKNEFPKSILICGSSWYEHPHNRPTFLSKCVSWLGCQVLKRHRF